MGARSLITKAEMHKVHLLVVYVQVNKHEIDASPFLRTPTSFTKAARKSQQVAKQSTDYKYTETNESYDTWMGHDA